VEGNIGIPFMYRPSKRKGVVWEEKGYDPKIVKSAACLRDGRFTRGRRYANKGGEPDGENSLNPAIPKPVTTSPKVEEARRK